MKNTMVTIRISNKANKEFFFQYALSKHASRRTKQRGISSKLIAFCLQYAKVICKQGLCFYYMGKKNIPDQVPVQMRKKLNNLVLVCNENDGCIITSYYCAHGLSHIKKKRKQLKKFAA